MPSGCSDGTREGFVNATQFPNIAGCSGGWSVAGSPLGPQAPSATVSRVRQAADRIRATSAHYASRCDQLQLAWDGKNGKGAEYSLRIRTRCPYEAGVSIRFAITRLWFDPAMDSCQRTAPT